MKIKAEIDLNELQGWDGYSVARTIAEEITAELKGQVKRELRNDPEVKKLVSKLKNAAIAKMLADFE